MSTISRAVERVDSTAKAAGEAVYLADLQIDGALTAGLVLSERPRARLLGVDVPPLPEEYVAVDFRDVPGINAVHMINDSWPLFPEETVEYVGQPILVIAGPDPAEVRRLVASTRIDYEDLPAVFGIDGAEALEAPDSFVDYRLQGSPGTSVPGKPDRTPVFTETFDTGAQEHLYLEPQAMIAWCEKARLTVQGSMQCPFYVRSALESLLGWGPEHIRVVQTTTGGAFGGKEEYPSVLAGYLAIAALKSGRPVRIVLDRGEDIRITTKRHPSRITLTSRLSAEGAAGEAVAVEMGDAAGEPAVARGAGAEAPGGLVAETAIDIRTDGGAFEGLSATVLQRAMFSATGVYRNPDVRVRGRSYRTNVVPFGAFRGFGSPQAFFAIEMHMCHLARSRGEDPLDFKRRHLLRQGDRTITGGTLRDPVILDAMIERAVVASDYRRKRLEYEHREGDTAGPRVHRGIGVSLFSHGCGFTGSGERDIIRAKVKVRKTSSDSVEILCSNVEMGQGAQTTLPKIVADRLGIGVQNVAFANPDTDRVPDSGPTVASRTSMIVGGLLYRAADELASMHWSQHDGPMEAEAVYEQPPEIVWDQERFTGDAYPAFSWGVNVAEIEVDSLTCEIRPLTIWGVYDIGRAIDERVVLGQMHGGIAQGLGYATSENLELTNGAWRQTSMTDYVVPGPLDLPAMHVELMENPHRGGPFGAKGAGEIPFTGPAPALADAVECALGVRVTRIPITPEYLEELIR